MYSFGSLNLSKEVQETVKNIPDILPIAKIWEIMVMIKSEPANRLKADYV